MTMLSVSLNLPESLYRRLEDRAKQTNRTVKEESVEALAAGLPNEDRLAEDLEATLAAMAELHDAALRMAAQSRLSAETSESLEQLHFKMRREGLSESEDPCRAQLLDQYERHMHVRAQAGALLARRVKSPKARGTQINKT